MNSSPTLKQADIAASYQRNGYYIAEGLLDAEECDKLKAEALDIMKQHARPDATVYVGVAVVSPMYHRLASDPRVVSVLEEIMPGGIMFMSDKFVFKSGAQRFATPWHIDAAYWPDTRAKLSVWIPLDDVSARNGTLKVVRGSHLKAWKHRRSTDAAETNGEFVNVISENQWDARDEIICEAVRGSAIFFSDRTVHASCTNPSGQDRYAIISTYHAPAEDEPFDKHFPARHVIVGRPA